MNIKQAKKIVAYYQKWRRGGDGPMSDPKQLGIAIDVMLTVPEKQYGDIATELRDAAIYWPSFMSNTSGDIVASFCFSDYREYSGDYCNQNYGVIRRGLARPTDEDHRIMALTFLLFVAEAITW
jgi:hypothetical protein